MVLPFDFFRYLMIIKLTDLVEIILFICMFYAMITWLAKDKQKNLLFHFYGFCFLVFIAHFTGMHALSSFLFTFSPVAITMFILFHQRTLQKNFLSYKQIQPALVHKPVWIEEFIKSSLMAIARNKQIICIIEGHTSIQEFLHVPFFFEAPLQKSTLDFLIDSNSFNDNGMIWLTQQGILRALNVTWQFNDQQFSTSSELHLPAWQQEALLITTNSDALVVSISPASRTFTIIAHGKRMENLMTSQAITMLEQYIRKNNASFSKGGKNYENQSSSSATL